MLLSTFKHFQYTWWIKDLIYLTYPTTYLTFPGGTDIDIPTIFFWHYSNWEWKTTLNFWKKTHSYDSLSKFFRKFFFKLYECPSRSVAGDEIKRIQTSGFGAWWKKSGLPIRIQKPFKFPFINPPLLGHSNTIIKKMPNTIFPSRYPSSMTIEPS